MKSSAVLFLAAMLSVFQGIQVPIFSEGQAQRGAAVYDSRCASSPGYKSPALTS